MPEDWYLAHNIDKSWKQESSLTKWFWLATRLLHLRCFLDFLIWHLKWFTKGYVENHDTTTACPKGKFEQVYIKSKCEPKIYWIPQLCWTQKNAVHSEQWKKKKLSGRKWNEHSYKVWFQFIKWFQRRLKCKSLQMVIPHMTESGELKIGPSVFWSTILFRTFLQVN